VVVSDRQTRGLIGLFGGLGAALLLGGLFAAGAMVIIPFQVGFAGQWGTEALNDPVFYLFASFGLAFLILAGLGAFLCFKAWRLYRPKRPAPSE